MASEKSDPWRLSIVNRSSWAEHMLLKLRIWKQNKTGFRDIWVQKNLTHVITVRVWVQAQPLPKKEMAIQAQAKAWGVNLNTSKRPQMQPYHTFEVVKI